MNLILSNPETDSAFNEALSNSQVARNWLINKLGSYISEDNKEYFLEVMIDPWTKTDKPSFCWDIYYHTPDDSDAEYHSVMNGSLVYRGNDNYSSHT